MWFACASPRRRFLGPTWTIAFATICRSSCCNLSIHDLPSCAAFQSLDMAARTEFAGLHSASVPEASGLRDYPALMAALTYDSRPARLADWGGPGRCRVSGSRIRIRGMTWTRWRMRFCASIRPGRSQAAIRENRGRGSFSTRLHVLVLTVELDKPPNRIAWHDQKNVATTDGFHVGVQTVVDNRPNRRNGSDIFNTSSTHLRRTRSPVQ